MKTKKKKKNKPHTLHKIEKANCDGMCSDKKLAPRSLGGEALIVQRSLHSKL